MVFRHPGLGPLVIDCDVLTVPGSDLRIVVYTAAPNSEAAEKLRLLSVIGGPANPQLNSERASPDNGQRCYEYVPVIQLPKVAI